MNEIFQEEKDTSGVNKESSERKLIETAQNGDKNAFGKLIRIHQKKLFRYIYGLVNSFDITEDIIQEAFIKAYSNIKTFRTEYAFYPWVSTIARNLAFNHIHREEKKDSLDSMHEKGFNPVNTALGPLEKLVADEGNKRFYQAVKKLPVKYRTVFVLRHFEDMDYAQIASYLKIPPGTVDSRLYRARQILMEQLKELL
ncbi:MAG: RNA polymerase sigma factor [Candidatus Zixiibacteriota bacterium]